MNKIKFQHNWNRKLDCPYFTTIRKWTVEKERYYRGLIGKRFSVFLNGSKKRHATLLHARNSTTDSVDNELLLIDTGMERKKALELFRNFGIEPNELVLVLAFGPVEG